MPREQHRLRAAPTRGDRAARRAVWRAARRAAPGRHGAGGRRGGPVPVALLVALLVAVLAVTTAVVLGGRSRDGYPVIVQPAPIVGGLGAVAASGATTGPDAAPLGRPAAPTPAAVSAPPGRRASPRPAAQRRSATRTAPRPTRSTPAGRLTARYSVVASAEDSFVASIEVTNGTAKRQSWSVRLVHRRQDEVRVKQIENGSLRQGGATTNVFVGDDVEPGETVRVRFRADKDDDEDEPVRPTACLLNDEDPCRIG